MTCDFRFKVSQTQSHVRKVACRFMNKKDFKVVFAILTLGCLMGFSSCPFYQEWAIAYIMEIRSAEVTFKSANGRLGV